MEIKPIAKIINDFPQKFGIPRQSGLANNLSKIVFEKEFRSNEALRSIDEFSHLWLIWEFSENKRGEFSPTVRPPRLGGNKRVGVFATRSSFRPNPLGLSSVELVGVEKTKDEGTVLIVKGADILSGTPIYDIKPYLSYTDSHSDAKSGFAEDVYSYALNVTIDEELMNKVSEDKRETLIEILKNDPRPSYHDDEERVYAFFLGEMEIKFKVSGENLIVTEILGG